MEGPVWAQTHLALPWVSLSAHGDAGAASPVCREGGGGGGLLGGEGWGGGPAASAHPQDW